MPHITITGLSEPQVIEIASAICQTVSEIVKVPLENVYLEPTNNKIYNNGSFVDDTVAVHIWWRRRSGEIQKQVADFIGMLIKDNYNKTVKIKYVNLDENDLYTILK